MCSEAPQSAAAQPGGETPDRATITRLELGMAIAEVTEVGSVLSSDRCAAPAFRLRDWATTGPVFVAGGLVSDKYRLAPAKSVGFGKSSWADELEAGAYEVSSLKAEPRRVGDAPDMAKIAREALAEATTPITPVMMHGRAVLLEQGPDVAPAALFRAEDGREVALNSEFVAGLTFESVLDEGQPLPPFFGRQAYLVRHRFLMHTDTPTGRHASKAEHRPVIVERVAYGSSTHVREGRKTHEAGKWQAVLMPIRLGS